jgi:hypothetical protein
MTVKKSGWIAKPRRGGTGGTNLALLKCSDDADVGRFASKSTADGLERPCSTSEAVPSRSGERDGVRR